MKSLEEVIKDAERDLVIALVLGMKYRRVSKKEARAIAREFLNMKKDNQEMFFNNLYALTKYREVRKVYIKNARKYYEEKDLIELIKLREKKGEIYGKQF